MENLIEAREPDLSLNKDKTIFWVRQKVGTLHTHFDRYRPHYLPDFKGAATVAAIPATNLKELARLSLLEIHDSTFGLLAVMATHAEWYGGAVTLSDAVVPEFAAEVEPMLQQCEDFGAADGISTVEQVYQADFIEAGTSGDWDSVSPWGCYFEENSLVSSSIPLDSSKSNPHHHSRK